MAESSGVSLEVSDVAGVATVHATTPPTENAIRWEVMQRVVVPHIHSEVCLCHSVIRPHPFLPCFDKLIDQRLHVNSFYSLGDQE